MLDRLAVLDEILERHGNVLGRDFHPYRNHTYRVANFHWCMLPGTVRDLYALSVAVSRASHRTRTAASRRSAAPTGSMFRWGCSASTCIRMTSPAP